MNDRGLNDMLAVLVLYRKTLAASETFNSLSRSLQDLNDGLDLLVYDNSPESEDSITGNHSPWRIHYRHDSTNPGIGRAYNQGCRLACELGKKWLLLLDQDTLFPEESLAAYCRAVEDNGDMAVFAPVLTAGEKICSPCRYRFRTGFHLQKVTAGVQPLTGTALLNSGLLINVEVFQQCGGFDERVRLDFADFVFNNRLRRHCDSFYLLPMECRHGFSGAEETNLAAAVERFRFFREGADRAANGFADWFFYRLVVLKRCLRLTLQFRSLRFITICLGSDGGSNRG